MSFTKLALGLAGATFLASSAYADPTALEVVISKPKPGVTLEQAIAADNDVAAFVRKQKGFVSRETGTSQDGEMFAIVHWATLADAEAAGAAFMNDPSGKKAMSLVDPSVYKHFVTR